MAPVPVQIQPTAPNAGDDEIELVPDLDTYVEHSMCSCQRRRRQPLLASRRWPGRLSVAARPVASIKDDRAAHRLG